MKSVPLFILWSLWISLEFLLGPYSHIRIHDNGDGLLPQLIASKIQFAKYGYSYFAPYMASGIDSAGQYLLPFSNLNSLLFMIFPPSIAYGLLMFTQRFLASYFMFRLARDSLKLSYWSSAISAFIFSLYNFSIFSFTLYHGLGVPAIPLILWSIEAILKSSRGKKYMLIFLVGIIAGYSNYVVITIPYIAPVIFIWFYFVKKGRFYKSLSVMAIFAAAAFLIQLNTILAVITNLPNSHRAVWNLKALSQSIGSSKYILFTQFYKSAVTYIIPITIVLIAFIKTQMNGITSKILLKISIILFIFPIIVKIVQPRLPSTLGVIVTFSWDRFEIISPFFLAITAGYSLNILIKNKSSITKITVLAFLIAILLGASLKIKIETLMNYAPFRSLYLHPDLKTLAEKVDSEKWRVVSITGAGLRSSYPLAYGLYSADTYVTLYPKTYHAFWSRVIDKTLEKDKLRHDDFVYWGNRIYLYGPLDFYSLDSIDFQKYYDLDLLSLANIRYVISAKPVSDPNLVLMPSDYRNDISKWQDLAIFEKLKIFLRGKYFGPALYVYENKKALPRFYIIDKNGLLEKEASDVNYSPDKIRLSAEAAEGSSLIAAINYYPYWQLTVNGGKTTIKKYQNVFLEIPLKPGENQVLLEYLPPYRI